MKFPRRKPKQATPLSAEAKRHLENYMPPEGVPIGLELASLGARLGAVLLDLLVTWLAILGIILAVAWLRILPPNALMTLVIILAFFAGVPYYILSELIWHGRTLGKRMTGIRVVSVDGRTLSPHQIVARNLLKDVEFFAPIGFLFQLQGASWIFAVIVLVWTIFVCVFPMVNKRKQRLGDVVAGTLVVVKPKTALLNDLAMAETHARYVFDQGQLDIYGRYELQTLEAILRDSSKSPLLHAEMKKVALTIAKRIGYTDPAIESDPRGFLMAFYKEQRERLESRQLFGDKRNDKFHSSDGAK
ncbi:MAG: RDD family protein [Deltaproteobacteria bacterium]